MKYPKKGESDLAATPKSENPEEEEEVFKLDMSVLTDSLSVPTNWISMHLALISNSLLPVGSRVHALGSLQCVHSRYFTY